MSDNGERAYKFFVTRPTEAFYALSKQGRDDLQARVKVALDNAGGRKIIGCQAYWATERWTGFGVEEFDSIGSQQKHADMLVKLSWQRYTDSWSVLGTTENPIVAVAQGISSERVYKASVTRPTEAFYALSEQDRDDLQARVRVALGNAGGRTIIGCQTYWATDRWTGFGVEEFDSVEALQKYANALTPLSWQRYTDSWGIAGIAGSTKPQSITSATSGTVG